MSATPIQRFEQSYEPEPMSGCWLWTGGYVGDGYGKFWHSGRTVRAHRWAWEHFRGPIADGLLVLHRCDVSSCVNPAHLFLGTTLDNVHDRDSKGRQCRGERHAAVGRLVLRGDDHGSAKLNGEQVRAIRADSRSLLRIALEYGVCKSLVSQIKRRTIWKHLP
jgi:hypothetical protein